MVVTVTTTVAVKQTLFMIIMMTVSTVQLTRSTQLRLHCHPALLHMHLLVRACIATVDCIDSHVMRHTFKVSMHSVTYMCYCIL
jgi:hypothetical protein